MSTKSTILSARIQSGDFRAPFPLNLSRCNTKLVGIEKGYILNFQVFHFPQKELLEYLESVNPYLIIQNVRGTLRLVCSKQGVNTLFVVNYDIVEPLAPNRYEVTMESETLVVLRHEDAGKTNKTILSRLLRPHLPKLYAQVVKWTMLWLEPPTIESVTEKLSEKQREEAARLLYDMFIA